MENETNAVETTETTEVATPAVAKMTSDQRFYLRTQVMVDASTCSPELGFEGAKEKILRIVNASQEQLAEVKAAVRAELLAAGAKDAKPQPKKKDFDAILRDILSKAKDAANAVEDDTPIEPGVGHTATVLVRPANVGIAVAAKNIGNMGYADSALGGWTFPVQAASKAKAAVYAAELAAGLRAIGVNVSVRS
jgi:hypothetical protein